MNISTAHKIAPPDGLLPIDEIVLVRRSFDAIWPKNRRFVEHFYDLFFALAPDARPLFPADLTRQRFSLMTMLASMVGSLDHPDVFAAMVSELSARHVEYGVKPEHYGPFGEALVSSLAQNLGESFAPETERAWRSLYRILHRLHVASGA